MQGYFDVACMCSDINFILGGHIKVSNQWAARAARLNCLGVTRSGSTQCGVRDVFGECTAPMEAINERSIVFR